MAEPITFYKERLSNFTNQEKAIQKKLIAISGLRLFVFLGAVLGVYFTWDLLWLALGIGVLGMTIFLWLLNKYTDLKFEKALAKAFININKDELKIASGEYSHRDQGVDYINPKHHFSFDVDLFGKGSFFQYLNRTTIKEGTDQLVNILISNSTNSIEIKQEAVKELASKPKWIQNYSATASLVKAEVSSQKIVTWLKDYVPFLGSRFRWIPIAFSIGSLGLIVLASLKTVDVSWIGYWLLLGLAITGFYLKRINSLAANSDKIKDCFRQYALLLNAIENESFSSEVLKEKQLKIQSEDKKASQIFKKLSKGLDALDNRNNMLSAILGNGFLLWDIYQSYKIELWINNYASKVSDWFEVVTFFDAYNSLGTFAFNHPHYAFPKLISEGSIINAESLGHPLLRDSARVTSNLKIDNQQFFIVTGANMAGKSTFLRTVSLHIVMANSGLPVCARNSIYRPIKLVTSMRTNDSLAEESSYFFSELKRLKFIVDEIANDTYFIILDEILKGTNSTDKAIGSRKFVEKLVKTNASGIIATHDLSLCKIEGELEPVQNYYFDAEIVNNELYFDYKLKKGICKNMNASFLLKKMDVVE